jgi:hypothetical protein
VYRLIKAGTLRTAKVLTRTVVPVAELNRLLSPEASAQPAL